MSLKKPKLKEKITTVEFPVLRYEFTILLTTDIKASYLNHYKYHYDGRVDPMAMHFKEHGDNKSTIFLKPNASEEVIAHECYHGIRAMQRNFTNQDTGNEEWEAYHLGWLVGKVHEHLKKKSK